MTNSAEKPTLISTELGKETEIQVNIEALNWITRHVFMRHGKTSLNEEELIQGSVNTDDTRLTETAISNTQITATKLNKSQSPPQIIVTSDLIRSKQTGKIIADELKISTFCDSNFNEFNYGDWEKTKKDLYHNNEWVKNRITGTDGPPKGEDFLQFLIRVQQAIIVSYEQFGTQQRILFVLHGEVIRAIRFLIYLKSEGVTTLTKNAVKPHQQLFSFDESGDFRKIPHQPLSLDENGTLSEMEFKDKSWPKSVYRPYKITIVEKQFYCVAEGPKFNINNVRFVPICLTYLVVDGSQKHVRQDSDNNPVVKVLIESGKDLEKLKRYGISEEKINAMKTALVKRNPYTGQNILAIPLNEIHKFNTVTNLPTPNERLLEILCGANVNRLSQMFNQAVDLLTKAGIPIKELGVYGGFAAGITHLSTDTIKDLDILVLGNDHAKALQQLAVESQVFKPESSPMNSNRAKGVDSSLQNRRHENTRIWMPDGWFVDVRVVRRPTDEKSIKLNAKCNSNITTLEGTVIDASESMSSPMAFKLRLNTGGEVTIASLAYPFIGLVRDDQKVEVSCASTDVDRYYMLVDQKKHGVVDQENKEEK